MKTDKDIINDALMARIRELEASKDKQQKTIEKLNISESLLRQFVFRKRISLLNGFAKFAEDNYKECAYSYGYEDIEPQVIDILSDLADDIDSSDKPHFADLFDVLGRLSVQAGQD